MKRTPIIVVGQVYLHNSLNEYVVVTKSTRGDIQFKGPGFGGMNEVELFLERFGPVDPADLSPEETEQLHAILDKPGTQLSTGWVHVEDEEYDEEFVD
jgi:hypothetical protein